ncbi:MAG: hypothetical protein FJW23_16695 [Acidimicrobiia bacterium]|nr:hypothetical protein [Acidimicrobiia bacterium]
MPDHPRNAADFAPDAGPAAEREARIEQLLLTGLDLYFAGRYEQAINVWTRIIFLERGHSRAHAYIERARGALAEQQREAEELLHQGVDAFNQGDTGRARQLITGAIDRTGPNDLAMVFLDRLNRLDAPPADSTAGHAGPVVLPPRAPGPMASDAPVRRQPWVVAAVVVLAAVVALVLNGVSLDTWFADGSSWQTAISMRDEPLPVLTAADLALSEARNLYLRGQLHEAMQQLETIGLADPARDSADALRADIQRQLLDRALQATSGPSSAR